MKNVNDIDENVDDETVDDSTPTHLSNSPLTITKLMVWTGGIAVALTIVRGMKYLSINAWNKAIPYNPQELELGAMDYIAAFVYGTCVTLFLFAYASKDFWKSPGKITLLIFTLICLIDWGLSAFANTMIIQNVEVVEEMIYNGQDHIMTLGGVSKSDWVSPNFEIFGAFFTNFAGHFGYLAGLPFLIFILFRSREQSWIWKFVWSGFVFFTVAMSLVFFDRAIPLPKLLEPHYFLLALGVPMILMPLALVYDLIRKHKIDGWTMTVCTGIPLMWVALSIIRLSA